MNTPPPLPTAWRDGLFLVLTKASPAGPNRCVFTNETISDHEMIQIRLSWGNEGPEGSFLPVSVRLLFSMSQMRVVTVKVGLSQREQFKRKLRVTLSAICLLSGLGLFVCGIAQDTVPPPMEYVVPGAVLAIFALTYAANTYTLLDAARIDENHVWLKGAKMKFLDSLPPLPRG